VRSRLVHSLLVSDLVASACVAVISLFLMLQPGRTEDCVSELVGADLPGEECIPFTIVLAVAVQGFTQGAFWTVNVALHR
jgi:hypothetical protein